jgi:hypothetical protein
LSEKNPDDVFLGIDDEVRGRLLLNDFLDASNDSAFEHDFDAVRMLRGFGEDSLNNPLCKLSAALILLFHNTHLHSRLDPRSILAIHKFIFRKVI